MPKSMFRALDPEPPPPDPEVQRRDRFLKLIDGLIEHLEITARIDIRDKIPELILIDRVIAREKPDESGERGSAVRKYATVLPQTHGSRGRAADTGSADEAGDAAGDDRGEHDESDEADDEPADAR